MTQWAVAYHPDYTQAVELVGPFRSWARADDACQRIEEATAHLDVQVAAQVVELGSIAQALDWIPEPASHVSGTDER